MEINEYLPVWVMIILLCFSLLRWLNSVLSTGDYRGISAITSRLYLLYAYIAIILLNLDRDTICFIVSLGLGALLLDEGVYWLTTKLACLVRRVRKTKEGE